MFKKKLYDIYNKLYSFYNYFLLNTGGINLLKTSLEIFSSPAWPSPVVDAAEGPMAAVNVSWVIVRTKVICRFQLTKTMLLTLCRIRHERIRHPQLKLSDKCFHDDSSSRTLLVSRTPTHHILLKTKVTTRPAQSNYFQGLLR